MKKNLTTTLIVLVAICIISSYCYASNVDFQVKGTPAVGVPVGTESNFDAKATSDINNPVAEDSYDTYEDFINSVTELTNDGIQPRGVVADYDDMIMPISDDPAIPTEMEKTGDVYWVEDNVVIDYPVNGNIYVIGKNIEISSRYVNGNIFVIADSCTISSIVSGSVYAISENMVINGDIDDLYLISSNATLGNNAYVLRSARIIANTINHFGIVNDNLYALSDILNFKSDEFTGEVEGDLYYTAGSEINGIIAGEKNYIENNNNKIDEITETMAHVAKTFFTANMIALIIVTVGIIVLISARTKVKVSENNDEDKSMITEICKKIGIGLVVFILTIVLSILLMATQVGFVVGILLLGLFLLTICLIPLSLVSVNIVKYFLRYDEKDGGSWLLFLLAVVLNVVLVLVSRILPSVASIIQTLAVLYTLGFIKQNVTKYLSFKKGKEVVVTESK